MMICDSVEIHPTLFHPPISRIYHTIPIEYNDSYMNVVESEKCSPIVPEVPWDLMQGGT
jgi:hypothetical protein